MADYKVAIIGAGFCGTMVAAHLALLAPTLSVALIDRNPVAGRGLAYGTTDPNHLLNVRTDKIGAFAGEPGHFWDWLQKQPDLSFAKSDFVPRMVFGRYLSDILAQSRAINPHLSVLSKRIVTIARQADRFALRSEDGDVITAERVVLALGNFPPDQLASDNNQMNPYAPATWESLADDSDILIVGTGLTSLDLVVTLAKTKPAGKIHLLSRHGLLPQEHTDPVPYELKMRPTHPATALGLYRAIRKEIAASPNVPWQSIIDALRPLNQIFWQSLPLDEQRSFTRHLRAYWDIHRHRCASQIMDVYRKLEQAGRLQLHHGTIIEQTPTANGIIVTWRPRGMSTQEKFTVQKIVRCTGPQADFRKLADPLVQNLLKDNLIAADALRLGVLSDTYTACNANNQKTEGLYVLGSLLKGKFYESVAVPELREQAAAIAQMIAAENF